MDHEAKLIDHETRIGKLEKWQIKIAVIVTAGAIIIGAITVWFVNYSLNKVADRILGG